VVFSAHRDGTVERSARDAGAMAAGTQGGIQDMSTPVKVDVDEETTNALSGLAMGDIEVLGEALELREAARENSGLDPRSFALVKIAALIALDSPPASYLWQISNAIDAGASPQDILGVLKAVAPQVGGPKAISAAPEIMVALGLALPRSGDF
jgi:4-carboxymuconolactone decarboxylase